MSAVTFNVMPAIVFVGLAIVSAVLFVLARVLRDDFAQSICISLGSAVFGGGLVFFLLRIVGWGI